MWTIDVVRFQPWILYRYAYTHGFILRPWEEIEIYARLERYIEFFAPQARAAPPV